MMENIILLVHLLTALAIIGLILMQQGKGAEMGASFGSGSSQTLFGASGSGNFFSKLTAIFAVIFFVTSFSLAVIAKNKSEVGDDLNLPTAVESEIPAAEEVSNDELPSVEVEDEASELPQVEEVQAEVEQAVEAVSETADELPATAE